MDSKVFILAILIIIGLSLNGMFWAKAIEPRIEVKTVETCSLLPSNEVINCVNKDSGTLCALPGNKTLLIEKKYEVGLK